MNKTEIRTTNTPFRQYVGPILAMSAAFLVYYCMYAFRKPFGAATWEGNFFGTPIGIKTSLAVSQIIGYALAKLIGTWICSGVKYDQILSVLLGCILMALASLFALPYVGEYMFVAMFFNGLALGMIWGFVMRPLEGRRMTEMLIAGLCVSFIIASGDVKSTGKWIMGTDAFVQGFEGNPAWMPFLTAMMYFPFLVLGTLVLFNLPRPTESDRELRSERTSMVSADRMNFVRHHLGLLIPLAVVYFFLTAYRDFRDTFQAEIFEILGITEANAFSTTERYVAFGVVAVLSIFVFIRDSKAALVVFHLVVVGGLVTCGVATLALQAGVLSGYWWMVLAGLGAYICYIAFHCIVFERMVAYTRTPGNAVFAMMIFDFVGYVAAILFMIVADYFDDSNQLEVLVKLTWILTIAGALATLFSMFMIGRLRVQASEETLAAGSSKHIATQWSDEVFVASTGGGLFLYRVVEHHKLEGMSQQIVSRMEAEFIFRAIPIGFYRSHA